LNGTKQLLICGGDVNMHALNKKPHGSSARNKYRGAGNSLAQPGRKQATVTDDFDFHMSYL